MLKLNSGEEEREGGRKRRCRKRKPVPDPAADHGESNSVTRNLPCEITLDILSRLPVRSVLNCKRVCKNWCKIIRNPCFGNTHLHQALLKQQQHKDYYSNGAIPEKKVSFLLLTLEKKSRLYHVYYFENRKSPEEIWELGSYSDLCLTEEGRRQIESGEYLEDRKPCTELKIVNHPHIKKHYQTSAMVGSCNGLVCLSIPCTDHIDDPIYICNPNIGEHITLPRFTVMAKNRNGVEYKKSACLGGNIVSGFGYSSSADEYKVVRIYYANPLKSSDQPKGQVQVYTLGGGSGWRNKGEISYSLQRYDYCPTVRLNPSRYLFHEMQMIYRHSPCRGVLANGALHWLDSDWNVVAFELAEEEFSLPPSPPCVHPGVSNCFTLQVLEGQLCVAHGDNGNRLLNIWSFQKESSEWANMFSISCQADAFVDVYWPISLTLGGKLLLRTKYKTLICYDPQTGEFKKQKDLITDTFFDRDKYPLIEAIIPHMNSCVSLKALGEKSKPITREMALCLLDYSSK